MAKLVSINISKDKGEKKHPVEYAVIDEYGIKDDGHSGKWNRQISILSIESIEEINKKNVLAFPGDFAENLTTKGLDLKNLKIGDTLELQSENKVRLEVTQIGKDCKNPCSIYKSLGYCIMPVEGIFCRVLNGGIIKVGDIIKIEDKLI